MLVIRLGLTASGIEDAGTFMLGTFETRGNIGIIWIDSPPVNAISVGVRHHIVASLNAFNADPAMTAVILICRGRTFMAGADIAEFGSAPVAPSLPDVIAALDASTKPVVASIHGSSLGGGFEIALACHWRVALVSAKIGLPEVRLGLLPGAGGTQRLPRLIGIERAFRMIVSGEPMHSPQAAKIGIIDRLIEGDLLEGSLQFAAALPSGTARLPRARDLNIDVSNLPPDFFEASRRKVAKEHKNLYSPLRVVDALEAAATLPFDEGVRRERELFLQCMSNSQSKALRHVFFAERKAGHVSDIDREISSRTIRRVGVIGAGTMGCGIAMNFLSAGIPVTLLETKQEALERGVAVIRKNYESTAAKGRLTLSQVAERMQLLESSLSYDDLRDADLLIEAVFETMAVKREVLGNLDKIAKRNAILATNTSYLSIDEMAASTSRPVDVLGLHFFSPANVMRLLEIVRGAKTAPDVLATALGLAKRINKIGVVSGNSFGFIGNRMLSGYSYQAQLMLLEGAYPEQIDSALRAFGMPMGILQMGDLAGLDIGYKSRRERDPNSFDGRAYKSADVLVEMGRLGQKTQSGYYDYAKGDRTPKPSLVVNEILERLSTELGFERRAFTDQEIVERCLLVLVNVGCEVLREGVATRASDIDIVYIYGYGFPAFRGGPMYWAENEIGLRSALGKLQKYAAAQNSPFMKASALLERLVSENRGFGSLDAQGMTVLKG